MLFWEFYGVGGTLEHQERGMNLYLQLFLTLYS